MLPITLSDLAERGALHGTNPSGAHLRRGLSSLGVVVDDAAWVYGPGC
jgi:hypothetical protein